MTPGRPSARKAWLWRRLDVLRAGDTQLVWIGVGFDGLGRALLAQGADVRVIETDHPDTLQVRRMLGHAARVEMRALRLPQDLEALVQLCAARPTTLVCEGMLMYLRLRDVARIVHALAGLPAPPRLVFSALDTLQPNGRGFRRRGALVRRWLARHGEPFRWRLPPGRACRYLASVGYAVEETWDGGGYGEYGIEAVPHPP